MGSCCHYKEFLKELDYIKSEMTVWGVNYDILQTVWSLKRRVKEWFPMNKVPQDIELSLIILEERLKLATEKTGLICERIMLEVERQRKEAYPDD